ncbi:unnamed protein product [Cylicocyclus nassatus]|uniref:Uncharacterized protein n=1 Tax=Cylicocyclus nassatus TaxID=53992 RepID=A0AA36H8T5_CYLNA|nr:unnamed protein product [Cylicocyclus nassatus]
MSTWKAVDPTFFIAIFLQIIDHREARFKNCTGSDQRGRPKAAEHHEVDQPAGSSYCYSRGTGSYCHMDSAAIPQLECIVARDSDPPCIIRGGSRQLPMAMESKRSKESYWRGGMRRC